MQAEGCYTSMTLAGCPSLHVLAAFLDCPQVLPAHGLAALTGGGQWRDAGVSALPVAVGGVVGTILMRGCMQAISSHHEQGWRPGLLSSLLTHNLGLLSHVQTETICSGTLVPQR
jgi:hypothetical protein